MDLMTLVMRATVGLFALHLSSVLLAQATPSSTTIVPNNRWALVVGVSGYSPEVGPLSYAADDARAFASVLKGDLALEPDHIRLLADKGPEASPTSANILAALDAILKDPRLDRANLFVFYFNGHGVATPKGDFLLPVDATPDRLEELGIPVREVIARIAKAGLKNVLFLTDACRAGTKNDFGVELSELCHKANLAVILGCAPGLRSYEDPSFGQGIFTHYLLEAIQKPDLQDASGTLWASRVANDVQERVKARTDGRYKPMQIPTVWAESTTLDVLLAAHPRAPISDEAVRAFRTTASRLERKDYAAAMIAYASHLAEEDRPDAAIEMLKTVDALGELTPEARYVLAGSLDTLGRSGEAERTYAGFNALPGGFWRDLGRTSSSSRDLDPALRLRAALNLFDGADNWLYRLLAYNVVARFGSAEQKLVLAKRLSEKAETARGRFYGASQVAFYEGRWEDSLRAIEAARQAPGDGPSDLVLYLAKLSPLAAIADPKRLEVFYDEGLAVSGRATMAWLGKAALAKNHGDAKTRVEAIRTALKNDPSPTELLLAARLAGPYIGLLREEFRTAAAKHPYAWRARLVTAIADKLTNTGSVDRDLLATMTYGDDTLTVEAEMFDYLEGFMAEAIGMGKLQPDVYRTQTDLAFLMLKDEIDRFGYDADLWLQIVRYGMFNQRGAQVQALVRDRLRFSPERAPKDLKPALLLLAMNRGDEKAIRLLSANGFEATERSDPQWFLAAYDAMLGRTKEASARIAPLAPPSPEIRPRMDALRTYLLAANGGGDEARRRLTNAKGDFIVDALHGLAWAELGDWKRAEPLLLGSAAIRDWSFLFVQRAALRRLDTRYRATGRIALSRDLAYAVAISEPGNPAFDAFSFAPAPGVAAFVGSTTLQARTIDDKDPDVEGRLNFSVKPGGAFAGSLAPASGEPLRMIGKVDVYGNVRGAGTWHGKQYALAAKIAPAALYAKMPRLRAEGQVFQLVGPNATRIVLVGRTKS